MAREIEIKCRLRDKASMLQAIEELGVTLSEPKKQHDVVYAWPGVEGGTPDSIWLRIRTENDAETIFTLKKQVIGQLDSIEHETAVADSLELGFIIQNLGYELYSDLTKIRQKGRYGDIEVCVDEVAGLGDFIEAEMLLGEDADHHTVVAKLWKFFEKLGLDREDEEHDGYDVLERRLRSS